MVLWSWLHRLLRRHFKLTFMLAWPILNSLFLRSYFGESWVVILEYLPVEDSNASPVS